jgi:diamine N-acetyltransferase
VPSDSRHVAERIARPWHEVADFVRDAANLPQWAHGLGSGVERREGRWTAETPDGRIGIRFARPNPYGVADHDVTLPTGAIVHVPLRVLPLLGGAEVVLTVQRAPGMGDDALEADAATVAADLARLKQVLESHADDVGRSDRAPELTLGPVTGENLPQAIAIRVGPEQEPFVAPVVESLAEASVTPTAWPRLVLDAGTPVAFVMANFDPDEPTEAFRCGIWRLNVDRAAQGRGVGRFAVEAVIAEARRRGQRRVTVLWEKGEHGPEGFYRRCGFEPTGEELFGEVVAARDV